MKFMEVSEHDKLFVMGMAVHAADLSNPTKNWTAQYKWAIMVNEEFFLQGEDQRREGQIVTNFCDRTTINIARAQRGFMEMYVLGKPENPQFLVEWAKFLPKTQKGLERCRENYKTWESLVEEFEKLRKKGYDMKKLNRKADLDLEKMWSEESEDLA